MAGDERILMVSFFQHPFYPEGGSQKHDANLVNCPVPAWGVFAGYGHPRAGRDDVDPPGSRSTSLS